MKYIKSSYADQYFPAVMVVMCSALLAEHLKNTGTVTLAFIGVLLVLLCLIFIIQMVKCCEKFSLSSEGMCRRMYDRFEKGVAGCSFYLLPSSAFALLLYPYVGYRAIFFTAVFPVIRCMSFCWGWNGASGAKQCRFAFLGKAVWIVMILMTVVMVDVYSEFLRNKNEDVGQLCMSGFIQALWLLSFSEIPVNDQKFLITNILFLFGSLGLVLENSAALMTELIVKAGNGERLVGDLRMVVFPFECLFTVPLLFLQIVTPWTPILSESQQDIQVS
nr:uncharacterized protein LOC129436700 [Misgurnus anguillicaudatus]